MGKGARHQARRPAFRPQDPHGGKADFYTLSSDLHDRHWHVYPRPSTKVSKEIQFKIISLHNKFKVNLGYETCLKNQNQATLNKTKTKANFSADRNLKATNF